jgi:hypothetical protein
MQNLVKFKEVQFILGGKVIFSCKDITLPDALKEGEKHQPIGNFAITISCFYY